MKQFLVSLLLLVIVSGCSDKQEKITAKTQASYNWKGHWSRDIWQNNAGLEITAVRGDSLFFEMNAGSGGHTGDVEGSAIITGNKASFYSIEDYDSCRLYFEISGDSVITVSQGEGTCYAAMGVTFEGKYYRDGYKAKSSAHAKEEPSETMVSVGVLNTAAEDSALRALTGSDYDLFLNSSQLFSDEEDLDSLHTRVRASGVRGLYTLMENIIMIDSSLHIWAAAIDTQQRVQYFTNAPDYGGKLPKTIEEWRSRFKEYPVVYRSR